MLQLGINRALWLFGIVQILAIFGFYWLAGVGHDRVALGLRLGFEAFGVGIGTAAFIALLPALQTHATTATSLRYSPVWPPYRAPF